METQNNKITSTNKIVRCLKCNNPMATMLKFKDGFNGHKCFKCKIIIKSKKNK